MEYTEQTIVTSFEVLPNAEIQVRKTLRVSRGAERIADKHHRIVLGVNDSRLDEVVGNSPFYVGVANAVWELASDLNLVPPSIQEEDMDDDDMNPRMRHLRQTQTRNQRK